MSTITLPQLIDCHVHFREPGLEHKATMKSEAASAVAGGVHTVCEMPNTIPPTQTIAALADKVRRAAEITDCDLRFFFSVTEPAHLLTLEELWTSDTEELQRLKKHCCGVKLFLENSTGNLKTPPEMVEAVFRAAGELTIPLVAHCEDITTNAAAMAANLSTDVSVHSLMRPAESEGKSIAEAIALTAKHNTPFHVVHLSTAIGLEHVRQAKEDGVNVTCQVCPHHLFLTTDDYETLGTLCKMNPPVRSMADRDALWTGLTDGTVDVVATDHAPHTIKEKQTEPALEAPSGVPGVETMLPLLLTVAAGKWPHPTSTPPENATCSYDDIARWCFTAPNDIFQLGKNPEDTITVDPEVKWTITADNQHSQCGWTPYEGWRVQGKVVT